MSWTSTTSSAERFSEDEARRIFARAARRQHAAARPDGLSLDDLLESARAAGLDPALVAAEAAAERSEGGARRTWHGVPVGLRRSRLLPARLSDGEWERTVDLLRAEFRTDGAAQQIGTRREWASTAAASGSGAGSAAYKVRVERRPDGDLVTVEAPNVNRMMGLLLGGIFGSMGVVLGVALSFSDEPGAGLAVGGVLVLLAVLLYAGIWLAERHAASRLPDRFDALLDRIDLLSRADDGAPLAAPADPQAEVPRLDLDGLPDATASSAALGRRRLRS